jgi:hypothetical protein
VIEGWLIICIILKFADKILNMPLEERRKHYYCADKYVILKDILTWEEYVKENEDELVPPSMYNFTFRDRVKFATVGPGYGSLIYPNSCRWAWGMVGLYWLGPCTDCLLNL